MRTLQTVLLTLCLLGLAVPPSLAQNYYAYVASESADEVALVRFNGENEEATVEETIRVGYMAPETEGAHGMTVAPDGEHWFVSIAHGKPYGRVAKYETGTNTKVDTAHVGMFPATMEVSTVTGMLHVANFNLHGKKEPSTISVVDPTVMTEVDEIETGIMPHGSRFAPDGRTHYSVAMGSGMLYEIDAVTRKNTRTLKTGAGTPKPTWADPHPSGPFVYVPNNGADEVVEVHREKWEITRRFETGDGTKPYNLEVSPDGTTLVVSYKGTGETGIWNLETGERSARLANTRPVTHGVVISPDSRYAFVSAEGIGGEPGTVDVFDLRSNERVASVEVGQQAGGIAFWKMGTTTTSAR
jgi:DNA-binding beta-propeller fold protein YncE